MLVFRKGREAKPIIIILSSVLKWSAFTPCIISYCRKLEVEERNVFRNWKRKEEK